MWLGVFLFCFSIIFSWCQKSVNNFNDASRSIFSFAFSLTKGVKEREGEGDRECDAFSYKIEFIAVEWMLKQEVGERGLRETLGVQFLIWQIAFFYFYFYFEVFLFPCCCCCCLRIWLMLIGLEFAHRINIYKCKQLQAVPSPLPLPLAAPWGHSDCCANK